MMKVSSIRTLLLFFFSKNIDEKSVCVDIYSACVRGPSPPVKKVELMCPEEEEEEERGKEEEMENNWRQKRRSIRKKKEGDAFKRDSLPLFFFSAFIWEKKGAVRGVKVGGVMGWEKKKIGLISPAL